MSRVVAALALLLATVASAFAVRGHQAMVASEHRLASEAGSAILRRGGNAVDAAVATALAACVTNPSSCGIGGGGFMLIFEQSSQKVHALDYRERAPAAATRDMFVRAGAFVPELSQSSGLAVAVPGEIAGLTEALRRFGSISFAEAAAPAIAYADEGFAVERHLARLIEAQQDGIRSRPALAARFLRADGTPLREGDILRQPDLARTLKEIAKKGSSGFYSGPVADALVSTVRAAGGVMTHADLAGYQPVWREPLRSTFRGYRIDTMPPPSSGGGVLVEILNILRDDDLAGLGHNSPTYLHLLAEAMQFSFADRAAYYGDPDFVSVPLAFLVSPMRTARLRAWMSAATTFSPAFYGDSAAPGDDGGTSHLSVIDPRGNAVACTTTINTAFGARIIAGETGILLNNQMDDFSGQPGAPNAYGLIGNEANSIAPGKRPLSSMTPTIVTRDGAAVLVVGASGGPLIITGTLQTLLNALVFGQDAAAAVAAPRVHHQWLPPALALEPGIADATVRTLSRMGHHTVEAPALGAVQAVLRSADGTLEGAADPRKGGAAAGW